MNRAYALFLDDERFPPRDGRLWEIVRTVPQAVGWIKRHGLPSHLSFDNDLGRRLEGRHLAQWLIRVDIDQGGNWLPEDFSWTTHSQNSVNGIDAILEGHFSSRRRLRVLLSQDQPSPNGTPRSRS